MASKLQKIPEDVRENADEQQKGAMKRALVTGGGGFIGSAIVRQLAAMGVETVVVDSRPDLDRELLALPVIFRQGDIRDKKFLTETCRGCDIVFHAAAKKTLHGTHEEYHSVNVGGTRNVIDACLASQVKSLVYTSTAKVVFTGNDVCGINEQTPCAARFPHPYPHTKMLAEKMVLAANSSELRTTALRPGLVWGPGDSWFIPWLVKGVVAGELRKIGEGRNLLDICYVENAAAAHLAAAASLAGAGRAAGEAYFISQGEPVIFWDWVNRILRRLEQPLVVQRVSFNKAYRTGQLLEWTHRICRWPREPKMTRFLAQCLSRSLWFSIGKAERDLGYQPLVSTKEGVNRTVAWIRKG
jgi:2-alkyl-3-oxoalkanoate reductase